MSRQEIKRMKSHRLIIILIALTLIAVFFICCNKIVSPDEMENLYASWLIYTGQCPYLDFHKVHTPLFFYFFALLFIFFKTLNALFWSARVVMYFLLLLNGWFLFKIAYNFFGRNTAALTLLCYLVSYPVLYKMTEVRPDSFVVLFSNISLMFLISKELQAKKSFFIAGIAASLAMLSKQSGIIFLIGISLFFIVYGIIRNKQSLGNDIFSKTRLNAKTICYFFLGVLIPLAFFLLFLYYKGALRPFLQNSIDNDFLRAGLGLKTEGEHWSPLNSISRFVGFNFIPHLLMIMGVFIALFEKNKEIKNAFFLISILSVISFASLFLTLHPWLQEFLLFSQYQSMVCGFTLAWLCKTLYKKFREKKGKILYLAIITLLLFWIWVVPLVQFQIYFSFSNHLPKISLDPINEIISLTNEGDRCLALGKSCLFRPSVYYYHVGSYQMEANSLRKYMVNALSNNILHDNIAIVRFRSMGNLKELRPLIKKYYVKFNDSFYVPGQKLNLNEKKIAKIEIIVKGYYRVEKNWSDIQIDDELMKTELIYLTKGWHAISCRGDSKEISIIYDLYANKKKLTKS